MIHRGRSISPCLALNIGFQFWNHVPALRLGSWEAVDTVGRVARATVTLDAAFCPVIPAVFNHVRRAVRPGRTAPPPRARSDRRLRAV